MKLTLHQEIQFRIREKIKCVESQLEEARARLARNSYYKPEPYGVLIIDNTRRVK